MSYERSWPPGSNGMRRSGFPVHPDPENWKNWKIPKYPFTDLGYLHYISRELGLLLAGGARSATPASMMKIIRNLQVYYEEYI